MIRDSPPSQDAFIHQIWNSYLKEYKRYAPDSMHILETRPEIKVTLTQGWYATLCQPKKQPHTKLGIPTSNKIFIKRYAPDTFVLKTKSQVKVTVTRKWYATLRHPKIHPFTKFGIPISKNIRNMLRKRLF